MFGGKTVLQRVLALEEVDDIDDKDDEMDRIAFLALAKTKRKAKHKRDRMNWEPKVQDLEKTEGFIGIKSVAPRAPMSKGKLIMPKKKTAGPVVKAAAPATKLKLDHSDLDDGWDDF